MSELIDLPELESFLMPAKVDTGAYTSALHCEQVRIVYVDQQPRLSFWVTDSQGKPLREHQYAEFSQRRVRNSFGGSEKRYVITTCVVLLGRRIWAEFTLANRRQLRTPILLGRQLLRNRFVLDVSQQNLSRPGNGAQ
jgi:hypothetical protein